MPAIVAVLGSYEESQKSSRYYQVLSFHDKECVELLDLLFLKQSDRRLNSEQLVYLTSVFQQCSSPLFVQVCFEITKKWYSFTRPFLPWSLEAIIEHFFISLEDEHGVIFVRHALAYVTAAKSGLSLTELEDILSCDDEVLNTVFEYWLPPFRRIPLLLWIRLQSSLRFFLVWLL